MNIQHYQIKTRLHSTSRLVIKYLLDCRGLSPYDSIEGDFAQIKHRLPQTSSYTKLKLSQFSILTRYVT